VLEAQDKIVELNYAVKRIPLPSAEKSREKVMREVKAHARLKHQHIVGYQATWIEAPPPGWQAEADVMIAKKTGASITDPGWTATYSDYLPMEGLSEDESSGSILFEPPTKTDTNPYRARNLRRKAMQDFKSHAYFNHQWVQQLNMISDMQAGWQEEADVNTGSSSFDPGWTDQDSDFENLQRSEQLGDESTDSTQSDSSAKTFTASDGATSGQEKLGKKEEPKEFLYIAMELCDGSLKDWLDTNKIREPKFTTKIFRQICSGVDYIHKQCMIHRDLKPDNIYLSQSKCIKIGDFGLATLTGPLNKGNKNSPHTDELSHHVGTKLYMAPEMEQPGFKYSCKVDVYSLGLILVELLIPFTTDAERYEVLTNTKNLQGKLSGLKSQEQLSTDKVKWEDLLSKMLIKKPDSRPNASEVLRQCPKTPKISSLR
jgi:translation initiation factor 2-alpha kinase 3